MIKKRGQLDNLASLAVAVAVLVITLTVSFLIMSQGKDQIGNIEGLSDDPTTGTINSTECIKSMACNSTSTLQVAVDTIPGWVPLIIIAFIGATLLGLVKLFRK